MPSGAAGALRAILALSAALPLSAAEVDGFLKNDDVLSAPIPPRPEPPKTRSLEQLTSMALREGKVSAAPEPCAAPLGIPSSWRARSLRFGASSRDHVDRRFAVLYDSDPASGEARTRALVMSRVHVFPKGRTEYEDRACLRLSPDGRLIRASRAHGRQLMAEDKPLDVESTRAKKLHAELSRFFLLDTVGLKPAK